jgi:hypothetical protein
MNTCSGPTSYDHQVTTEEVKDKKEGNGRVLEDAERPEPVVFEDGFNLRVHAANQSIVFGAGPALAADPCATRHHSVQFKTGEVMDLTTHNPGQAKSDRPIADSYEACTVSLCRLGWVHKVRCLSHARGRALPLEIPVSSL